MIEAVLALALGAALANLAVLMVPEARVPRAPNHRGTMLPLDLGPAVTTGVAGTVVAGLVAAVLARTLGGVDLLRVLAVLGSILAVFAAGLLDDLRPGAARGLREHAGELLRGRVTTGIVKLVAAVAAGAVAAWALDLGRLSLALAVPVIAGSANLWNLLDVRPGRAVKLFLVAGAALLVAGGASLSLPLPGSAFGVPLLPTAIGAAVAILPRDLRERGMLGDSGSNVLGLVVGLSLAGTLSAVGLGVALAAIVALHALGETVTLSRIVDAAPPLRWFDDLGTLRDG